MTVKTDWSTKYDMASQAALATSEAERRVERSATVDRCKKGTLLDGDPVCVCPVCKSRRASDCAIGEFDIFWRHFADESDLASIRRRALQELPNLTLENGTESREEILRPPTPEDPDGPAFHGSWKDADEFQQYLATNLPEIEYYIGGDPPEASADWADTDCRARGFLETLTKAAEVTKGAAGMSRRAYAAEALRLLDEIKSLSQIMARAPDEDAEEEASSNEAPKHEQRWLMECFAEISVRAFNAGVLARAAAGKAIEADAVKKRQETATNRKNGALGGQGNNKAERHDVLNRLAFDNVGTFTNATDPQRLRNAKVLARKYDTESDPKLFHDSKGKLLSDRWFKDWLAQYLALANCFS